MSADLTATDWRNFQGAARRRALEQRAFERIPLKVRSHASYLKATHKALSRKGYALQSAEYDAGGNCTECGEAGRCPGWHIAPGSLPSC